MKLNIPYVTCATLFLIITGCATLPSQTQPYPLLNEVSVRDLLIKQSTMANNMDPEGVASFLSERYEFVGLNGEHGDKATLLARAKGELKIVRIEAIK